MNAVRMTEAAGMMSCRLCTVFSDDPSGCPRHMAVDAGFIGVSCNISVLP